MKKCPECGSTNSDTSTKCVICGKPLLIQDEQLQMPQKSFNIKSKLIAFSIVVAIIAGLILTYKIYIDFNEKKHISCAEEAVLADNCDLAIEEYEKIPEKSKRYSEVNKKIETLNSVIKHIEKAEFELSKKNYIYALNESKDAVALNSGLPKAENTYKKIQDKYIEYIDGLIANDEYKSAFESVNMLKETDKWEEVNNIEKKINDKIFSLYEEGNAFFDGGSYESALNDLCAAVDINPNYNDTTDLKTRLAKVFADSTLSQFKAGNIDNAVVLMEKSEKASANNADIQAVKSQIEEHYLALGNEKLNGGAPDVALTQADNILKFVPSSDKAADLKARVAAFYVEKGNACLKNNDPSAALNYGQLAKNANPQNEWAPKLINEANTYSSMLSKVNEAKTASANGNYSSALSLLDQAFTSSPYIKENYQYLYDNIQSEKAEAERLQREIEANPIVIDESSGTHSGIAVYELATIRNRSSRPINYIKAVVELLDDNKEIINSKNWYFSGETLYPGEHVYLAEEIVDMGLSTRNRVRIVDFRYAD